MNTNVLTVVLLDNTVGSDGVRRVQRRFPEPPAFSDSHSVIRSMASLALESDLSDSEQSAMLSSARVSSARLSTTGKSQRSIPFSFANSAARKARARAAAVRRYSNSRSQIQAWLILPSAARMQESKR